MKEITQEQLYAFVRLLKEKKPFDSLTNNKVTHWIDLLNILLDNKIDQTMDKLNSEGLKKRFETVAETLTIEEFDDKINCNKIKQHHIIGTRLLDDGRIEVLYTIKVNEE